MESENEKILYLWERAMGNFQPECSEFGTIAMSLTHAWSGSNERTSEHWHCRRQIKPELELEGPQLQSVLRWAISGVVRTHCEVYWLKKCRPYPVPEHQNTQGCKAAYQGRFSTR